MRFSYIDSQGKEIEVDSVESLALRIELGAIKPDTRMYDAVADHWAPAEEHPVFRTLSRGEKVEEDEVVPIGHEAPDRESDPEAEDEPEPTEAKDEPEPPETEATDDDGLGLDFRVTLSEDEEEEKEKARGAEETEDVETASADGESADGDGDFEEKEEDDSFGGFPALEPEEPAEAGSGESGAPGPSTETEPEAQEVEDPDGPEPGSGGADSTAAEPSPWGTDTSPAEVSPDDAFPDDASPDDASPSEEDGLPSWAAEGEALWDDDGPESPESGDAGEGAPGEAGDGPSAGEPEAPPPPDPEDRMPEWAVEEPEDAPSASPDTEKREKKEKQEKQEKIRRERPAAPRPAHWEERARASERRQRLVRIAAIVMLVLAVGGTTAWVLDFGPLGVEGAGESTDAPARPVLPPDLRAVMTEVGAAAYDDVLVGFREEWTERELPQRPPPQWLDGVYLSTAGDFPGVRSYWEAVRTTVNELRADESDLFRERLEERLAERSDEAGGGEEAAGLSSAEMARVREAALSGFRMTAPERGREYESILRVADASLELHRLLVEREDDIAYEPYSDPGVSRDPVLEAVPADSVLRVEMNERLDRVLESVVESELPRPITTSGLAAHLVEGLREVGVVAPRPPSPAGSAPDGSEAP